MHVTLNVHSIPVCCSGVSGLEFVAVCFNCTYWESVLQEKGQDLLLISIKVKVKVKQSRYRPGPENSRKLRFPDFLTTAQGGGKIFSLMHRPHLPPGNTPGTISVREWFGSRAKVRSEGFMAMKNSNDTSWDWTSDLLICSAVDEPLCYPGPD
jgi:hypothetical protein